MMGKGGRPGPTCRSWDQSALLSACQRGMHHHRLHHPQRRFRLSHTERCCLTAVGKAERKEIMKIDNKQKKQQIERKRNKSRALQTVSHRNKRSVLLVSHFSYKVVPHAELWRNELLSVGGSLRGHGRRSSWRLLYGASWNQHPHVESAPVAIYILCWRLSGGCGWTDMEQNKKGGKIKIC